MPAILAWFASHLLASFVGEIFKRAAIFAAFNIVMQFVLAYMTDNGVEGLTPFSVGPSLSSAIASIADPRLAFFLDAFYVPQGLFLILNAYLARFAYRLTLRAVAGG
ncbi:MAG: hypothetical protein V4523_14125 [Pseudomonadota bacterium]